MQPGARKFRNASHALNELLLARNEKLLVSLAPGESLVRERLALARPCDRFPSLS